MLRLKRHKTHKLKNLLLDVIKPIADYVIKCFKTEAEQKLKKVKTVSVHYKGQLVDGTVFDSSYKRNQPIDFALGVGQVISGWDEGIQLLKVGDKARFIIPSDLLMDMQEQEVLFRQMQL